MAHFTRDNRMQKSPQHDVINIDAQGIKIVFFFCPEPDSQVTRLCKNIKLYKHLCNNLSLIARIDYKLVDII